MWLPLVSVWSVITDRIPCLPLLSSRAIQKKTPLEEGGLVGGFPDLQDEPSGDCYNGHETLDCNESRGLAVAELRHLVPLCSVLLGVCHQYTDSI